MKRGTRGLQASGGSNAGIEERSEYLIYVPPRRDPKKAVPLVFALSPNADARAMIHAWKAAADRHGWIVAASKTFHNEIEYEVAFDQIERALGAIKGAYPIDAARVVLSGFSGGAMAAHAFAQQRPGNACAVVANTGMLEESFMQADYPSGALAVFLASPSDFRFREMHRDRQFLEAKGWKTKWIEFRGGHILAPEDAYLQASDWLAEKFQEQARR